MESVTIPLLFVVSSGHSGNVALRPQSQKFVTSQGFFLSFFMPFVFALTLSLKFFTFLRSR